MKREKLVEKIDLHAVDTLTLFGERDANLRWIEQRYDVEATLRGSQLAVTGEESRVGAAAGLIRELIGMLKGGRTLSSPEIDRLAGLLEAGGEPTAADRENHEQPLNFDRRAIFLKSPGQRSYVEAIRSHDVVFGIGPAGTGKTYLAVALAILALKERKVERIVLVRPAVEAGENLGFLPGGYEEKVDPYLRPLYDALRELLGHEKLRRFIETGVIEIAPLAYMRGRTLSNSFVILDEAQNTTVKQMKMFLTRLGPASKAVITGDVTQIDLDNQSLSGLVRIQSILSQVPGISFCYFHEQDVVRHRLVKEILRAFEVHEAAENGAGAREATRNGAGAPPAAGPAAPAGEGESGS